jgi:hypothetical protein
MTFLRQQMSQIIFPRTLALASNPRPMWLSDLTRYGLYTAVVATALRNRKEYGVPTAWLTHLAGNTVTLLLPDMLRLVRRSRLPLPSAPALRAVLRTIDRRVRQDPNYAGYVAPLALGFVASHPDYSIYHGRWAELKFMEFGIDSLPHSTAAYALARLMSETILTLEAELPPTHPYANMLAWASRHVDALASVAVIAITLIWEISEYLAHQAELAATGRPAEEINMQWSLPDALTDSVSNLFGLLLAINTRHRNDDAAWSAI